MKKIIILALLALCLIGASAQIRKEQRIALVVGNSYSEGVKLMSPENDAKEIARLLDSLSFKVVLKTNLGHEKMDKVIKSFCNKAKGYDVALFFFCRSRF